MSSTTKEDDQAEADARELARTFTLYQTGRGDIHALLARMREECPIAWSDELDGYWLATGYEESVQILRDPVTFSSNKRMVPPNPRVSAEVAELRRTDPPAHTLWRHAFAASFSPTAMGKIRSEVRRWAQELLRDIVRYQGTDFVRDFCRPFPARVFLPLLGLPPEQLERLLELHNRQFLLIHSGPSTDGNREQEVLRAYEELAAEIDSILAYRRSLASPPDDLIGTLMSADLDGRPLTRDEMVSSVRLLFGAGLDTVKNTLSMIMWNLAVNRDRRQLLQEDRSLIPRAVEEYLRFYSSVTTSRLVTEDVTLGGVTMRRGDMVLIVTPAADRDERQFNQASDVEWERPTNRHIAFGAGPHRCLGSHLARLELQVALEEIMEFMPDFELEPGAAIEWHYGLIFGLEALPLVIGGGR